jgi:replication initiation and membrane attachment protein DnaB
MKRKRTCIMSKKEIKLLTTTQYSNIVKITLSANKKIAIQQLRKIYIELIMSDEPENPIIQVFTNDHRKEYKFHLPIELDAFIKGLTIDEFFAWNKNNTENRIPSIVNS